VAHNLVVVARHVGGGSGGEPGNEAKEGISDRGKPSPSRGTVKAVSILWVFTQAVLQWRRRDPEGDGVSEAKSCTERDHVALPRGKNPREGHAPVKTRPRCRTARRSGSSASWNDGPFGRTIRSNRRVTKQAESRERGYRFRKRVDWQKSVGRIAAVVWEHGRLARGRSPFRVERARRYERGRIGVRGFSRLLLPATPRDSLRTRKRARAVHDGRRSGSFATHAPHRAGGRRSWLTGESQTSGNGTGGELTSRTGAVERCS